VATQQRVAPLVEALARAWATDTADTQDADADAGDGRGARRRGAGAGAGVGPGAPRIGVGRHVPPALGWPVGIIAGAGDDTYRPAHGASPLVTGSQQFLKENPR